jgi:hypothetical protein
MHLGALASHMFWLPQITPTIPCTSSWPCVCIMDTNNHVHIWTAVSPVSTVPLAGSIVQQHALVALAVPHLQQQNSLIGWSLHTYRPSNRTAQHCHVHQLLPKQSGGRLMARWDTHNKGYKKG